MKTWQKIGEIGVDAGLCWIGDPCYIMHKNPQAEKDHDKPPKAIGKSWSDFCDLIQDPLPQQFNYDHGHAGLGVLTSTGHGDGSYDVFVQRTKDGLTKAVKVVFIND